MKRMHFVVALAGVLGLSAADVAAQGGSRSARVGGTATVWVGDGEYTIPIECDEAGRPELGFSTEPNRITRERTGRTSMVNLRVRQWQETEELVVSLDRYVAWMPRPASVGGLLSVTLDLSPASVVRENRPVALTYDMWTSGDRPAGLVGARFEAQCTTRDPDAPSYRKLPGSTP